MKAIFLLVELKREAQYCEHEIRNLVKRLPPYAEQVIWGSRQIGFLMPNIDILPALRTRLRPVLDPFENYWLSGMSGEVVAKNGSYDPLAISMKQYVVPPPVGRRERLKP